MKQVPDSKDGAAQYEASGITYQIRKLPTPRMGEDRWHWMVAGGRMVPGAAGHQTEGAAVDDLKKYLRLIGA